MTTIRKHNLFIVGYGLSGGFGGIHNYEVINAPSLEVASKEAYELAYEEYQNYDGTQGLRTEEEILEEAIEQGIENPEEYAAEEYNEEVEGWIEYICLPWSRELEKDVRNKGHYHNPFMDITNQK